MSSWRIGEERSGGSGLPTVDAEADPLKWDPGEISSSSDEDSEEEAAGDEEAAQLQKAMTLSAEKRPRLPRKMSSSARQSCIAGAAGKPCFGSQEQVMSSRCWG